ncbi:hypothetical protein ACB092_07G029600 [Castanea dentata]
MLCSITQLWLQDLPHIIHMVWYLTRRGFFSMKHLFHSICPHHKENIKINYQNYWKHVLGSVNCGTSIIIKYENYFLPRRHESFISKKFETTKRKIQWKKKSVTQRYKAKVGPIISFSFLMKGPIISESLGSIL